MFGFDLFDDGKDKKRSLGIRDKQILWERAKKKCEACSRRIDFIEMQAGHKKAHAKGGATTLGNSVCLCYKCNKLQGTDDWRTFLRKTGKKTFGGAAKMSAGTTAKSKRPAEKKAARRRTSRDPLDGLFGGFRF